MALLASSLALLAFATQAFAAPTFVVDRVDNVDNLVRISNNALGCGGTFNKAVCCGGTLLGAIHVGCVAPFPAPTNHTAFVNACEEVTKTAQCCSLNVVSFGNATLRLSRPGRGFLSRSTLYPTQVPQKGRLTNMRTAWQRSRVSQPSFTLEGGLAPETTDCHW